MSRPLIIILWLVLATLIFVCFARVGTHSPTIRAASPTTTMTRSATGVSGEASPAPSPAREKPILGRAWEAERCVSVWYGDARRGHFTASGDRFNPDALTAAHRTLPFGTRILVTHAGRSVTVRINDRGPRSRARCLDLSQAAFARLAPLSEGVIEIVWQRV